VTTQPGDTPGSDPARNARPGRPTLRRTLLIALTAAVGLLSWRYPALVNPTAVAVGVFAVLDRLTAN
jgi:hypothetical protein